MYVLKHGIKKNPERFWALPDRIFFGYGACHILAGTFLRHPPTDGFYGERIIPGEGFSGNHLYVTNGVIAFDYHGYSSRERLLEHTHGYGPRTMPAGTAGWKGSISICSTPSNSTCERCAARISICMIRFLAPCGFFNAWTTPKPQLGHPRSRHVEGVYGAGKGRAHNG